jgi:ribosomal protein S27E
MAATVTITCPECDKQIKAPAAVLGKKIRCKSCGHVFLAQPTGARARPAGKPAKPRAGAKPAPEEDEEDANPYGVADLQLAPRCPNCAADMDAEDVVCLNCGYNTVTRQQFRPKKVRDVTGFDVFLWLLPGILCVLVILALITFDVVYCLMIDDWIDKEAWYSFLASLGVKIWLVIPTLFLMYVLGRFAFKRLIIDNSPPEVVEKWTPRAH